MYSNKLHPGSEFPSLVVSDRAGQTRDLSRPSPEFAWLLLVVYRGRHCQMCTRYLNGLAKAAASLAKAGIELVAVSADSPAQLDQHRESLGVDFPLYHSLSVEQMLSLGLYISDPIGEAETDHRFAEPAMFVLDHEARVRMVDISNGPFARPDIETLSFGLGWLREPDNDYPIRGTSEASQPR